LQHFDGQPLQAETDITGIFFFIYVVPSSLRHQEALEYIRIFLKRMME